jgi:transposase
MTIPALTAMHNAPNARGGRLRQRTRKLPNRADCSDSERPLACPRCGSQMKIIVLITDPVEVRKMLRCSPVAVL